MKIPRGGIAFFDSGIGGLTVLNECIKRLPNELFYYYGDNAHAPYGNLPMEQIRRYVFSAFEKLKKLEVRAAVVACNTATALCIEELRRRYDFPIIGAEPAVLPAAKGGGEVYILCTRATYNSKRLCALCARVKKIYPLVQLRPIACDALAGAIEENLWEKDFDFTPILPKGNPSAVVLGCTHYVYVKDIIENFYRCEVYDGNEGIANRLTILLEKGDFVQTQEKNRDGRPPTARNGDLEVEKVIKKIPLRNRTKTINLFRVKVKK